LTSGAAARSGVERGFVLENDSEREVQRAARTDERAGQLEVGARVDEEPRVLVAEAEETELFEAPADDALILERSLE
jgi:hypothetical protein